MNTEVTQWLEQSRLLIPTASVVIQTVKLRPTLIQPFMIRYNVPLIFHLRVIGQHPIRIESINFNGIFNLDVSKIQDLAHIPMWIEEHNLAEPRTKTNNHSNLEQWMTSLKRIQAIITILAKHLPEWTFHPSHIGQTLLVGETRSLTAMTNGSTVDLSYLDPFKDKVRTLTVGTWSEIASLPMWLRKEVL